MDTEYSNLDTSANIPLINELTDFLATEAAELATNEDVNDDSLTPTNLDALDYKPVSIVHLRNIRNNKIQQKPLMVMFDTGAQKSTVKAKHSHLGHGVSSKAYMGRNVGPLLYLTKLDVKYDHHRMENERSLNH
jgi:hypothetical protein